MAETRKHRVEARDDLDRALFAALGEPVRPATPGQQPAAGTDERRDPQTPTPATGRPLDTFTFGAPRPAEDSDHDADS